VRLRQLAALACGLIRFDPNVSIEEADWVRVEGDANIPVQVDGEMLGTLPVEISLHRKRLHLLLPLPLMGAARSALPVMDPVGIASNALIQCASANVTNDRAAACELATNALRPLCGRNTVVLVNDHRGHAAVPALSMKQWRQWMAGRHTILTDPTARAC
jgi:hypothetical protein